MTVKLNSNQLEAMKMFATLYYAPSTNKPDQAKYFGAVNTHHASTIKSLVEKGLITHNLNKSFYWLTETGCQWAYDGLVANGYYEPESEATVSEPEPQKLSSFSVGDTVSLNIREGIWKTVMVMDKQYEDGAGGVYLIVTVQDEALNVKGYGGDYFKAIGLNAREGDGIRKAAIARENDYRAKAKELRGQVANAFAAKGVRYEIPKNTSSVLVDVAGRGNVGIAQYGVGVSYQVWGYGGDSVNVKTIDEVVALLSPTSIN